MEVIEAADAVLTAPDPRPDESSFSYGRTFVLGLGYFSISVAAAVYNSFVPLFLKHYLLSSAIIGLITSFRTLSGIVLNVYFSARSDRTATRFGRRIPYLVIGMPIAAILFLALPWQFGAAFLIIVDILYAFSSNIFYAPTISLMPDVTPPESRSKANGIINLMGGIGALLMYFTGAWLFGLNRNLPFVLVAILFLVVPAVLVRFVREPKHIPDKGTVAFRHLFEAGRKIITNRDRTGRHLLIAIFLWSLAESSIQTFFVTYNVYYLHKPASVGTISIGIFSLAFMLFAFPAGMMASKIGRKTSVALGLAGFALVLGSFTFVHDVTAMRALIIVGGLSWALVNVNGYPWVTTLTSDAKVGAYTGLFMLCSGIGSVVGQPFIGFLMDQFGYPALFVASASTCAIALVFILTTRSNRVSYQKVT